MLGSRRAIFKHANSIRHNCAIRLSSTSHNYKNLQFEPPTPEDLNQAYKTAGEGGEVEAKAAGRGNRGRGAANERRRGDTRIEDARDIAKGVAVGAIETGLELGKIGKHVMDGVWEAAEKTAHTVIHSIADDAHNDNSNNNHRHAHNSNDNHRRVEEDRSSDKFVEDLRRKGGGYDLKGHL